MIFLFGFSSILDRQLYVKPSVFLCLFHVNLPQRDIVLDNDVFFNHEEKIVRLAKLWKPFLEQFFEKGPQMPR
jgi:hypothetical protein